MCAARECAAPRCDREPPLLVCDGGRIDITTICKDYIVNTEKEKKGAPIVYSADYDVDNYRLKPLNSSQDAYTDSCSRKYFEMVK